MKVLVLTNLFPNQMEPGRAVFNKQHITQLSKLCELKVVAPIAWFPLMWPMGKQGVNSQVPARETMEDIEVFHPRYFCIPKIGRSLYGLLFFLSIVNRIRLIQHDFRFDVIFGTWAYPDGFAAALIARLLKKTLIIKVHGTDINEFTKYYLRRKMIVFALRRAQRVISVSDALKMKMIGLGVPEKQIRVISNGIDTKRFKPMDKNKTRRKLNIPIDSKILLFVGNLVHVKGLSYLLDALHSVRKHMPNILLVLVGDGILRAELQEQAKELGIETSVTFQGVRPHDEIPLWMNSCDLFCLPSLNEGCPNVILEALACGKPVVASNVGGIPELVPDNEHGILVPPANSAELAKAIEAALKHRWDSQALSSSRHSWKEVAQKTMEEFEICRELGTISYDS